MSNQLRRSQRLLNRLLFVGLTYWMIINLCIGDEQKMFKSSEIVQWKGGISLEFSKGESTQRISYISDSKVIKIKKSNFKGVFDLDKVELDFKYIDGDSGLLSVRFVKGLSSRKMLLGIVSEAHWTRFRDQVKSFIKIEESSPTKKY